MTLANFAAAFTLIMTAIQLVSTGIARWRCPQPRGPVPVPLDPVPISLIRPVCGLDNFAEETLRSGFVLDYPSYELLFCAARADDSALPLVRRLMEAYPKISARILVGDDVVNANPKLNNCIKGWNAARYPWVVMADANVLMPPDYLQRLLAAWRSDTGLVCSTPIGSSPGNFWAELECGFLNTLQARWQYVGETLGLGFAQGKSMLWRRDFLNSHGGIRALGAEIAEDAAATKLIRRNGLHVHLVNSPFEQPLGIRSLMDVWNRQVRWARLRRKTFPPFFALELLTGCALPVLAAVVFALSAGYDPLIAAALVMAIWMAAEVQLALATGWRVTLLSPFIWLLRDLMLPVLFAAAWTGDDFVWRGHAMDVRENSPSMRPGA